MRRRLLVTLVVLLGLVHGGPLAAQQPAPASLDARLDGRVSRADRQRIVALVDSLVAAGVARAPLSSKALEGVGKRASGAQIETAIRRLGMDLQRARAVLGAGASASEVEAGADALRAGASTDALVRIKASRGRASAILPLATLTDLVSRGVPADDAARTVIALSEQHSPDAAYREAQQRASVRAQPAIPQRPAPGGGPARPGAPGQRPQP